MRQNSWQVFSVRARADAPCVPDVPPLRPCQTTVNIFCPLSHPPNPRADALDGPVRQEAVLPDRAVCLPTFSHFVIVNKTSLSLSLSVLFHTTGKVWRRGVKEVVGRLGDVGTGTV